MNKQRRKDIARLRSELDNLKNEIEQVRDEEQEYYDNMPENMQIGEKVDVAQQAVDTLGRSGVGVIALLGVIGFLTAFAGIPLMDHGHPFAAGWTVGMGLTLFAVAIVAEAQAKEGA